MFVRMVVSVSVSSLVSVSVSLVTLVLTVTVTEVRTLEDEMVELGTEMVPVLLGLTVLLLLLLLGAAEELEDDAADEVTAEPDAVASTVSKRASLMFMRCVRWMR